MERRKREYDGEKSENIVAESGKLRLSCILEPPPPILLPSPLSCGKLWRTTSGNECHLHVGDGAIVMPHGIADVPNCSLYAQRSKTRQPPCRHDGRASLDRRCSETFLLGRVRGSNNERLARYVLVRKYSSPRRLLPSIRASSISRLPDFHGGAIQGGQDGVTFKHLDQAHLDRLPQDPPKRVPFPTRRASL